jgi:hypothetical protein
MQFDLTLWYDLRQQWSSVHYEILIFKSRLQSSYACAGLHARSLVRYICYSELFCLILNTGSAKLSQLSYYGCVACGVDCY